MADTKTPEEQIKDLQTQINLLTAQTNALTSQNQLLTAQIAQQVMQQTIQASVDKGTIDKLKELVDSQTALAKAQGSAPFAELQGINEGLKGLMPAGKEGTIAVAKGTDGALLLRVKKEMLDSLDEMAKHIVSQLKTSRPNISSFVIASNTDIESAYKSEITLLQLGQQSESLEEAKKGAPLPSQAAGVLETVATVPFVLNALSDAAKFFRVDRTLSVYDTGEEAKRLLELFVEAHAGASLVTRVNDPSNELVTEGKTLLDNLNTLKKAYDQATDHLGRLQKLQEDPAGQSKPVLPDASKIATLKGEVESAKVLLDSLSPVTNANAFWSQVAGQIKDKRIKDRARIEINVSAQTVQVLQKRTWRSDRLLGAGDIQVDYRITDASGKYLLSGLKLYTSETKDVFAGDGAQETTLPKLPATTAKAVNTAAL